jgi:hypothetical protein
MRKGIFDPWRQGAQTPVPPPAKADPREAAPEVDPDAPEASKQCVTFHGTKAGINIWLPEQPEGVDTVQLAQDALVDAVHKLYASQAELLEQRGVSTDASKPGLSFSKGAATIVVGIEKDDDKRMRRLVDTLALALRAAINDAPSAERVLKAAGIKPFVK